LQVVSDSRVRKVCVADKRRGQPEGGNGHDSDEHVFKCNVSGMARRSPPKMRIQRGRRRAQCAQPMPVPSEFGRMRTVFGGKE
jgi:hypothetical protein